MAACDAVGSADVDLFESLDDLQKTCLDRLLDEANIPRKKRKLPTPVMKKKNQNEMMPAIEKNETIPAAKKEGVMPRIDENENKEAFTTVSEKLWDDEWCSKAAATTVSEKLSGDGLGSSHVQGQQGNNASSSSSHSAGKPNVFPHTGTHPKGFTPKGTRTTPKGVKSKKWIPNPNNPYELQLREIKDRKNAREKIRKQANGVYTTYAGKRSG